jgi:hypothetical protein
MAAWIVMLAQNIPQDEQDRLIAHAHARLDYHVRQKFGMSYRAGELNACSWNGSTDSGLEAPSSTQGGTP